MEMIFQTQKLTNYKALLQKGKNKVWVVRDVPLIGAGPNDNLFYFTPDELKKSYKSLEGVPVIINKLGTQAGDHADYSSLNVVGHVYNVKFDEAKGIIYGDLEITDPDVGAKLERKDTKGRPEIDGVSIGSSVEYFLCSVDNKPLYECGHEKGEVVNGKTVYAIPVGVHFEHLALTSFPAWRHAKFNDEKVMVVEASKNKRGEIMRKGVLSKVALRKYRGKPVRLQEDEGMLPEDNDIQATLKEILERLNRLESELMNLVDTVEEEEGTEQPAEEQPAEQPAEQPEENKEEGAEMQEGAETPPTATTGWESWPVEVLQKVDEYSELAPEDIVQRVKDELGVEISVEDVIDYLKTQQISEVTAQEETDEKEEEKKKEEEEDEEMDKEAEMQKKKQFFLSKLEEYGVKVNDSIKQKDLKALASMVGIARKAYMAKLQSKQPKAEKNELPKYVNAEKVKENIVNLSQEEVTKAIKEGRLPMLLQKTIEEQN